MTLINKPVRLLSFGRMGQLCCSAEWNREEIEKEVEVDFTREQLNRGKRFYGSILRQGSNTENKRNTLAIGM